MSVWKDKQRGYYRYKFQKDGKNHYGWGYQTKKEAVKEREAHKERLKRQILGVMGFKELANVYLDYAQRNFAPETYKGKVRACKLFLATHGDADIQTINPAMIQTVLNTRPTNNSHNAYRKDLSAVFQYAVDVLETLERNPVTKVPKASHTPAKKVMPSEQDVLRLIMATDPETDEKDLLLTVLYSFARIDEVLRLRWEDVNFRGRVMTKWTRKRKGGQYEPIDIKMNDDLFDVLWSRWQERKQNTWVFFNEKTQDRFYHRPKFMKGLCKRAGIVPHFGFHTLRHYMASLLADDPKVGTKTIQKILGHKSVNTTEIYLHSVDESITAAMTSLDGKFTGKNQNRQHGRQQKRVSADGKNAETL